MNEVSCFYVFFGVWASGLQLASTRHSEEEDGMGGSFWISYPRIWCISVEMLCGFLGQDFGLVNGIHEYLLHMLLLAIWYVFLMEIEGISFSFLFLFSVCVWAEVGEGGRHHCRISQLMTLESLWSPLCYKLRRSRGGACLVCAFVIQWVLSKCVLKALKIWALHIWLICL